MSGGRKRAKRPKAGDDAPPEEPGALWFFLFRDGAPDQLARRQREHGHLLKAMLGEDKREDSGENMR